MGEVLTYLVGDLPAVSGGKGDPMVSPGGSVVEEVRVPETGRRVVGAVFWLASDAVRSAVAWADATDCEPGGNRSGLSPRLAICTCDRGAECVGAGRRLPSCAVDLLGVSRPGQIVVAASTAVLVGHALPAAMELVGIGTTRRGRHRPERVYSLRTCSGALEDSLASNMGWARRAAPGPVVGREAELQVLEGAWRTTQLGRRYTVLVTGGAGIGKTTIAAVLALKVHAEGGLVLHGRWDKDRVDPYQAVREAFANYASACSTGRLRADLGDWVDHVARLWPEVGRRVGVVGAPQPGNPDQDRLLLFEGIEQWLARIASRRPTLLVLDDLQSSEDVSLQLVEHLQRSWSVSAMILATERLDSAGGTGRAGSAATRLLAASAEGAESLVHVDLSGLDVGSIADLVEQVLGRALDIQDAESAALVERLTRVTSGNPLFLQELLRQVPPGDDVAGLRSALESIPSRMADVVSWRLTQLPAPVADLLATASVIGPQFDLDLVVDVAGVPAAPVRGRLEEARREAVLREVGAGATYGFAHEVVYQTLRDSVDPGRAAVLHQRVAVVLAQRAAAGVDVPPDEIADHHLRGVDPETVSAAVDWARRAAQAAAREAAFETAVQLLERALDANDRHNSPGSEQASLGCELRAELAEAHYRAAQFVERDRRFLEAAALARQLGRVDLLARAALGFGGQLPVASTRDHTASRLLREAIDGVSGQGDAVEALLKARLAQVEQLAAPYEERRSSSKEAVAIARGLDDPTVLAAVLVAHGVALGGPDDPVEELTVGAEVEEIGERIGQTELVLQGARLRIQALLAVGRHDEARRLLATYAAVACKERHPDHQRIALMFEVLWAGLEGRYAQGEVLADDLHAQLTWAGYPYSGMLHFAQRSSLAWLQGKAERYRPDLDSLRAAEPDAPVWWATSVWLDAVTGHLHQASLRLAEQDPETFVHSVNRNYRWWPTMIACTVAAALVRDANWARALYQALLPYAGQNVVYAYSICNGAVDHQLGTLAAALGRDDEAIGRLELGLERHEALGAKPYIAVSARWLSRLLARRGGRGNHDRAELHARRSVRLADELGLHGLPRLTDETV